MPNILIIEDDENIATAYSDALKRARYTIKCVGDGHAGVRAIASFQPDLILLDMFMPVFSGLEFLEVLNKVPELVMPKIIVCTNVYNAESNDLAISLGAAMCIIKDTTIIELLALVARTPIVDGPATPDTQA